MPGKSLSTTFTVNSAFDVNDLTPGNGLCVAYIFVSPPFVIPFCTLRGAIEETNSLPGEDTIILRSGMYSLTKEGVGEDNAATGDLDITDSLSIIGEGAKSTFIDGKAIDRIFDMVNQDITVTLKNLTILNGVVTDGADGDQGGGALRNVANLYLKNVVLLNHKVGGESGDDLGGLILNSGSCRIVSSTLQGGSASKGGGIHNEAGGTIIISSSTISDNEARWGAGIRNFGDMYITNSTISGNGLAGTFYGGGLDNWGNLDMLHVTVTDNSARKGGGLSNKGIVYLQKSIIAGNSEEDCDLPRYLFSDGHNLDGDKSCSLYQKTDISGVNPAFEPLKNYGGVTRTHELFQWSPALDNGGLINRVKLDQRGIKRPRGRAVDIGAVESIRHTVAPLIYPLLKHTKKQ